MDFGHLSDKQNEKKQILHSSQNKRVKVLGNSVILVAINMINQKKIMHLKKMKVDRQNVDQPAFWSSKINLQYTSLDKNNKNKKFSQSQKQKCVSNINILKKQAQLLQEQNYVRRVRFSMSLLADKPQQRKILSQNINQIKTSQGKRKPFKGRTIFNKQNHALINWRKIDSNNDRSNLSIEKQGGQLGNQPRRAHTSKKSNRSYRSFKQSFQALNVQGFQRRDSVGNCFSTKKSCVI